MEYELWHWGVKGMRWGVRRYQNSDGSLTPAGKKRYNQELAKVRAKEKTLKNKKATQAKLDKLEARKKAVEEEERALNSTGKIKIKAKSKPKNVVGSEEKNRFSEMSNQEIQAKIDRIRLEKTLSDLTPKHVSTGQKIVNGLKDSATSILKDKGTKLVGDVLDKKLRNALGLNEKDPVEVLKRQAAIETYKVQIDKAKQYFADKSKDDTKTPTRNLIGNIDDLTDKQISDMIARLDNEKKLKEKLKDRG